uniref:Importin subunit beta-1/Transportin-1-like TPR repeats domain-containing protein n=1 Tax=Fagus sylvatica TaxID=28930 RepID=A0A2N9F7F7_FAGSY
MTLFLRVFACRSSTVHEEAMLAISALAYACGPNFENYMREFYPYLEMGLQNFEEYQVCSITVGVVGDICRALDDKLLQFCDGLTVKPPIFSCFGDIALAIGEHFDRVMEYGNQLRRSIFEAYSGILQGFKNSKPEVMLPHAAHLLQFIELVFLDRERDESVTKAAVAVMGDLADALGSNTKLLFRDRAFYVEFLGECLQSDDEQLKETATWTQGMIGRVMVS